MSDVEKLADKTTFPKSVPYPHFYPRKRYHFLIFFQLTLELLLFLMNSDPFLPIPTHANFQVLLSDKSNADHVFGTNGSWPNLISFPFSTLWRSLFQVFPSYPQSQSLWH